MYVRGIGVLEVVEVMVTVFVDNKMQYCEDHSRDCMWRSVDITEMKWCRVHTTRYTIAGQSVSMLEVKELMVEK